MNTSLFFQNPSHILEGIRQRMRLRRKSKKLSQARLSELSGVSLGSLKRFEQSGEISLQNLLKIAFALDCANDFEALFARKEYQSLEEVRAEREAYRR